MSSTEETPLLGEEEAGKPAKRQKWYYAVAGVAFVLVAAVLIVSVVFSVKGGKKAYRPGSFFVNITETPQFCDAPSVAWTGLIGLAGDSDENPKRSFFWYTQAEEKPETAPLVLTVGGGPGTSGLVRMWFGDGPCVISRTGAVPNPHRWTRGFNYLAIDHPIGAGFSYGQMVNSSADAARDIYDVLQKFYSLFPDLQKQVAMIGSKLTGRNDLHLNGGSYGGMYLPHMGHEINEQNKLLAQGKAPAGTRHVNLRSLMISNPMLDPMTHVAWLPETMCKVHQIWNESDCATAYDVLPSALEAMRVARASPTLEHRLRAMDALGLLEDRDLHGLSRENYREKCNGSVDDCHPEFQQMNVLLRSAKTSLGVPDIVNYTSLNFVVTKAFFLNGDMIQDATRFFPQLLQDGIRILHREGMLDLNCAWPGVLSSLKLVPTPYQDQFINATDIPWPGEEAEATLRVIGEGAGDFSYIQLHNAGHFVGADAPRIEYKLAQHWIHNKPFS